MRRLWLFGATVLFAVAACSGSPTTPTPPPTATCSFSISTTTLNVASLGATATLSVTTGSACAWTAASSSAFINVTSGASQTGPGTVNVTISENTGDARVGTITIGGQAVVVNQAASDPLFGSWAGSITKGAGCAASLPSSVPWTAVIRRTATGTTEIVITAASIQVVNQVLNLTINGNTIQFAVVIDAIYTFTATLAADRRSFNGTFSGVGCTGTWTGTRQ